WYTGRHLADVVAVPGFVAAQRFRVLPTEAGTENAPAQTYMALYTMRTDDPNATLLTLRGLVESGRMEMSEAMSFSDLVTLLYEPISPAVTAAT
ncbi:MAG: hypothetical protein ACRYG8_24380, partial [Janthinobacterium lividum]